MTDQRADPHPLMYPQRIRNQHLHEQEDLEIINIYRQPGLAKRYKITTAPNFIKFYPSPTQGIIGDQLRKYKTRRALEIIPVTLRGGDAH